MTNAVLAVNAGSSSLKFALFEASAERVLTLHVRGQFEGIGGAPHFVALSADGAVLEEQHWSSDAHENPLSVVLSFVEGHLGGDALRAVGHRVVHGGRQFARPALVTDHVMGALDGLSALAPLHQPHTLSAIRAVAAVRPGLPQVACFDTAFHHSMPEVAARLALPRQYTDAGVRRYGFHGLSYDFIARRLHEIAPALAAGRVIVAHLGNGASLCALRQGLSVDTTMGFTALDGLVMGTRCGTTDPGAVLHLIERCGMSPREVEALLYQRSGLLGVSGISNDMRALQTSDNPQAREAIELFVFRLVREAGALASSLGGIDGFVFTAGIGEHAAPVRRAVCERLAWLGVRLDAQANDRNAAVISTPDSHVDVRVIPTDEEAMIARYTLETLEGETADERG